MNNMHYTGLEWKGCILFLHINVGASINTGAMKITQYISDITKVVLSAGA